MRHATLPLRVRAVLACLLVLAAPGARPAPSQAPTLRVVLIGPDGARFPDNAHVQLLGGTRTFQLARDVKARSFLADPPAGTYELRVRAQHLVSVPRKVQLTGAHQTLLAHLGEPGWPHYRLGGLPIPFEPQDELVAVCYTLRPPPRQDVLSGVPALIDALPLVPIVTRTGSVPPHLGADGAVLFFEITDGTPRATIEAELRARAPGARVGLPLDLTEGRVKVLDNRYRVRFSRSLTQDSINQALAAAGALRLRGYLQSPTTQLVAFGSGDYGSHLGQIETWRAAGTIEDGEPDLIAQVRDDDFLGTGVPDDPAYPGQSNLGLQRVPEAWARLAGVAEDMAFGSPAVRVAVLDRSLELSHPDLGGNLTDGEPQIVACYDALYERDCGSSDYGPADEDHGMMVFGIIGARTDNGIGSAGIAPNAHQITVTYPPLEGSSYADALMWAAGFDPGVAGWPAPPDPGADVLCCAHGGDGLALSDMMSKTFDYLTTEGRGGLGTVIVYSSGGNGKDIEGYRTWAADSRTLAVGFTMKVGGEEVGSMASNYGDAVDLCAYGYGVTTLTLGGTITSSFGGTSAAAPTVAATVALMLSANPDLTWTGVRDVLRSTAEKLHSDEESADPIDVWKDLDGDGEMDFSRRYGYGRVNVLEAVVGAASRAGRADVADAERRAEEPGEASPVEETVTLSVSADVVFDGDPAQGAKFDVGLVQGGLAGYALGAAAVFAGLGADSRPPAGEWPDRALLRDLALEVGADGWDPEPFGLTWDAELPPDRVWCRMICVLHPTSDASLPTRFLAFDAEWPVPASNTPPVTYEDWSFTAATGG